MAAKGARIATYTGQHTIAAGEYQARLNTMKLGKPLEGTLSEREAIPTSVSVKFPKSSSTE